MYRRCFAGNVVQKMLYSKCCTINAVFKNDVQSDAVQKCRCLVTIGFQETCHDVRNMVARAGGRCVVIIDFQTGARAHAIILRSMIARGIAPALLVPRAGGDVPQTPV